MTTILCCRRKNETWVASDKLILQSYSVSVNEAKKTVNIGKWVVGAAGDCHAISLLEEVFFDNSFETIFDKPSINKTVFLRAFNKIKPVDKSKKGYTANCLFASKKETWILFYYCEDGKVTWSFHKAGNVEAIGSGGVIARTIAKVILKKNPGVSTRALLKETIAYTSEANRGTGRSTLIEKVG